MTRASFEPGARLLRLEAALREPTAILRQIGAVMVAESQSAFKRQAFGRDAWEPRRSPNVFGLLSDFAMGRKDPPKRRFEERPALRDTGRLAQSIAFEVIGADVVQIGTNVEYASVHQYGGRVYSVPITKALQDALWAWMKRKRKAAAKRAAQPRVEAGHISAVAAVSKALKARSSMDRALASLGWLLNRNLRGTRLEATVPARPFVGITDTTRRNIGRAIGVTLTEAGRGSG